MPTHTDSDSAGKICEKNIINISSENGFFCKHQSFLLKTGLQLNLMSAEALYVLSLSN